MSIQSLCLGSHSKLVFFGTWWAQVRQVGHAWPAWVDTRFEHPLPSDHHLDFHDAHAPCRFMTRARAENAPPNVLSVTNEEACHNIGNRKLKLWAWNHELNSACVKVEDGSLSPGVHLEVFQRFQALITSCFAPFFFHLILAALPCK